MQMLGVMYFVSLCLPNRQDAEMLFQLQANKSPTMRDIINHAVLFSLLFVLCILGWQGQAGDYKDLIPESLKFCNVGEARAVPLPQVTMWVSRLLQGLPVVRIVFTRGSC